MTKKIYTSMVNAKRQPQQEPRAKRNSPEKTDAQKTDMRDGSENHPSFEEALMLGNRKDWSRG